MCRSQGEGEYKDWVRTFRAEFSEGSYKVGMVVIESSLFVF